MKRRRVRAAVVFLAAACLVAARPCPAAAEEKADQGGLRAGDHLAVVGDSITEQKLYSVFIEDYLLMCKPASDLTVTQFGWSGETSWGFAKRVENDMLPFGCTAATTHFGMNDGGYGPMDDERAKRYHGAQTDIVRQMKAGGVRFVVVGSPGCVDADAYHNSPEQAEAYNKTLAAERDIARKVADEQGVAFADVFTPMSDVMAKAKARYGRQYTLAGGDGIHPEANGHLVMAYAFLKALGVSGDIGTITVDLRAGKAEATDGHKILGARNGVVEVESARYPFCFYPDMSRKTDTPGATRSVVEFLPFNEDLNRFRLVVKNPPGERVRVSWGKWSKAFPADQLAAGINLAAEFPENPFNWPFRRVENEIRRQQNVETQLVKVAMHGLLRYREQVPDERECLQKIAAAVAKKDEPLREASARAVLPVRHVIRIEAAP